MIEVWLAQQNSDLIEGRGSMVTKAAFTRMEDAERAAQMLDGVMGVGHGSVAHAPLKVYESLDEWEGDRNSEVRARALAKLTDAEKKALGIR